MDFDHSEDVINQEDIPLVHSSRLDSITMDMDDVGEQSHPLMEAVNDEVIGRCDKIQTLSLKSLEAKSLLIAGAIVVKS